MAGIFGTAFDFNHDGHLDAFERAAEFGFLEMMERETGGEHTELTDAGIDPEELEYMSEAERREILEGAGLNPDDYDF